MLHLPMRITALLAVSLSAFFALWFPAAYAWEPAVRSLSDGDVRGVAERLAPLIAYEMEDKRLPALSIALIEGDRIVWSKGFGFRDPQGTAPADADAIYRVGSVSKLITALAVMQLVEKGVLNLDEPVEKQLPGFSPSNPFDKPVTLRQLLSHRAGLVREPPSGHYFDPSEPSLEATVSSLNATQLVYAPETRTKYSNAGPSVAGLVVERVSATPFARHAEQTLLRPLGMNDSSFELGPKQQAKLASALMWTVDGREFPAPSFALGTGPAGNLYSSVNDLSRLLIALFAGGKTADGAVLLQRQTLEEMYRPQFSDETAGFGLGFYVSQFEGHRRISHGGAVYGYSTLLAGLPDEKLGVVVAASRDVCNAAVGRIGDHALRLLLAARSGASPPEALLAAPLGAERARVLAGRYRQVDGGPTPEVLEATARGDQLLLTWKDKLAEVKADAQGMILDDEMAYSPRVDHPDTDTLVIEGNRYVRLPEERPAPAPERWRGLIGEYGWDHNTLYILESYGRLYALIEWFFWYPLEEIDNDTFAFPDFGLYHGEKIHFTRDEHGRATEARAAEVRFLRRSVGPEDGGVFRIEPLRPIDVLRRDALAASPPQESGDFLANDLVELRTVEPTIRYDIRYATKNNFMGEVFYTKPRAYLQRSAAESLAAAHRELAKHGFGILVHDAYRPWHVTKMFYDATPQSMKQFVADPSKGSRHNRGCAVDLTLYDLASGEATTMVSGYDEFSPRAFPHYPGGQSIERWRRDLLRRTMEAHGFNVFELEWWHFDYRDWRKHRLLNVPFDDLEDGTNEGPGES